MTTEPERSEFARIIDKVADEYRAERRGEPTPTRGEPANRQPVEDGDATVSILDPSSYVGAAIERECREVAEAPEGTRNPRLNEAAFSLGRLLAAEPPFGDDLIDEDALVSRLYDAAEVAGLVGDDGARSVRATISSGLRGGARKPLVWSQASHKATPFGVVDTNRRVGGGVGGAAIATGDADDLYMAELARQRAQRRARRHLDAEDAATGFRFPPSRTSLVGELAIVDPPVIYAVDKLLPAGGNALLTAAYKTGKTTVLGDLARAFADGSPFLGTYKVNAAPGRLAVFNYELDESQYRRWLRELRLDNLDAVTVLHLRGYRLPVITPHVEDAVVAWLQERDVSFWIVDPFARAFTGCGSENDNGEVGRFLDTLDVIKERAGVRDLVVATHTGRAEMEAGHERARGATRLDDWADVRWLLVDDEGTRYFRATGRDVEVGEHALKYEEARRGYSFGGGDRKHEERKARDQRILDHVNEHGPSNVTALRKVAQCRNDAAQGILAALVKSGHLAYNKDTEKWTALRREVIYDNEKAEPFPNPVPDPFPVP